MATTDKELQTICFRAQVLCLHTICYFLHDHAARFIIWLGALIDGGNYGTRAQAINLPTSAKIVALWGTWIRVVFKSGHEPAHDPEALNKLKKRRLL